MTAVASTTETEPAAAAAEHPESERRGVLTIAPSAAKRVVSVTAERHPDVVSCRSVRVTLDDDGCDATASIEVAYPRRPLAEVLGSIRVHLADEVGKQLGRPLRRVELTVADFVESRHDSPRVR